MPAHRYELFIDIFEKKVSEYQKIIQDIETMQQPYNLVKDCFVAANLDNETSIDIAGKRIESLIHLMYDNHKRDFEPLIESIGKVLLEKQLHRDGIPARGSHDSYLTIVWHLLDRRSVVLYLCIPYEGTKYCTRTTKEFPTTRTEIKYEWFDEPIIINSEDCD